MRLTGGGWYTLAMRAAWEGDMTRAVDSRTNGPLK